ncbi:MAG TPA: hypothetical protein VJ246_02745 [Patescibacteria group bacterium]|nr:hypothetical protein [Patescibacteria group bacterium]
MKQKVQMVLFSCALAVFFYNVLRFGLSSFTIGQFDEPLRILTHRYVTQGLELYKDVGVVYPPGPAWLIGWAIPFYSMFQRNLIFTTGTTVLLLFIILQIKQVLRCVWTDVRLSFFLLIAVLYLTFVPGEPFSWTLLALLSVVYVKYIFKNSAIDVPQLFMIGFAIPFFRWDHALLFFIVQAVGIISLLLISIVRDEKDLRPDRASQVLAPAFIGYVVGIITIAAAFFFNGSVKEAYEFIIHIPSNVIMEYRKLPLPHITAPRILNAMLYISLAVWTMVSLVSCKARQHRGHLFLILLLPFSYVPYATGRADWMHAVPLLMTVALVVLFLSSLLESKKVYILCFSILLLPITRLLIPSNNSFSIVPNKTQIEMDVELQDCKQVSRKIDPRSIFVGRESYQRFIVNTVALYLLKPTARPATRYISDEPGIQNDCEYGARIVTDLRHAPKPMLAFIELGEQKVEQNKTQYMQSCGVVESYLHQSTFVPVGSCTAFDQKYDVRVYP